MDATHPDVATSKDATRKEIWTLLEQQHAVSAPTHNKIPDFVGSDRAARRLTELAAWHSARVVKTGPDTAQLPVRIQALEDGKLLYMAVPKLAQELPFYLLDPARLPAPPAEIAAKNAARELASMVSIREMQLIDLIICGSVAVDRNGIRLGKGAGYADIEVALLTEAGLVGPQTVIATTVHALQVVDGPLPEREHDFRVDIIATPDETILCTHPYRPSRLIWDDLSPEKIATIPVLAAMRH